MANFSRYTPCAEVWEKHEVRIHEEMQLCYSGSDATFPNVRKGDSGGPLIALVDNKCIPYKEGVLHNFCKSDILEKVTFCIVSNTKETL